MRFLKVHGAGNDFVLLPDLDNQIKLSAALVRGLCDRHRGLGADGVIRLAPPRNGTPADVFMDYRNADGGIAEMCGNGVRCVAKYVADRALVPGDAVRVDTRAGVKPVVVGRGADGLVDSARVDMGLPQVGKVAWPLEVAGQMLELTTLSMGNPHAVLPVGDVAEVPLERLGPALQRDPHFPDGTNVEVIAPLSDTRVAGRIWERGVGETLASGTGAAAMGAAAHLLGWTGRTLTVALPGGELAIDWGEETLHVSGPAVEVAAGRLEDQWLNSLD